MPKIAGANWRVSGLVVLALTTACSNGLDGKTYLTCFVLEDTTTPFKVMLDEQRGSFTLQAGDTREASGPADFMTNEVWISDSQGNDPLFFKRDDLTWGKVNGPTYGQCEKTSAPTRAF